MQHTRGHEGWKTVLAALFAAGTLLAVPCGAMAQSDKPAAKEEAKDAGVEMLDEVIFRNGNKVQGKIISETETTIRMRVMFAGISTETDYPKADILDIKKGAVKGTAPAKSGPADAAPGVNPIKAGGAADDGAVVDVQGKPIPEGTAKVYLVDLRGEFGRQVTKTPVTQIMDDIKRVQPEIVVFKFNFDFSYREEGKMDVAQAGHEDAFFQLELARELDTLIIDRFNNTSEFKTPPRAVAWVKKALGGAAFLPCVFKEIYFTRDGLHGGIGGLESLFAGRGDHVVREKQRSLLLGRAEGLAAKGGHDIRLMRAMSRGDTWLCYKIDPATGQVVLREEKPDSPEWILLKDDGQDERADLLADIIRGRGNDYLTLNADTAAKIGWSKGTADTVEDLLFAMGIERSFALVKHPAPRVLKDWSESVAQAEDKIRDLLRKFERVEVRAPGGPRERNQARSQRINILEDIGAILERYKEAINPQRLGAWPENLGSDVRIAINRLRQEIRNDRP